MRTEPVRRLLDLQLRRHARPDDPRAVVERDGPVVRRYGPGWSGVLWSDLDRRNAPRVIARQCAHFAGLGGEWEWKVYGHDRPTDLGRRLRRAGLVPGEPEAVLVAETSPLPHRAEPPRELRLLTSPLPERCRGHGDGAGELSVERAVRLAAEVHAAAFGHDPDPFAARLRDQLDRAPGSMVLTVLAEGELPVSAARLELPAGADFAGLWGGGTRPEWRGRGLYRALVAHRAALAARLGYRFLQVDALPTSRPVLRRLGFRQVATTTPYLAGP
ncbi:GNAT family N-acetyltransferase [Streptomyces sp. NPDC005438]|uniref:GNAT family N-acetyltransferase n=1 Tax=Streptomyces sp. NPDC005438 TaxID=3156880 RepID=UPI0033AB181D